MKSQGGCRCDPSKSDGYVSVGRYCSDYSTSYRGCLDLCCLCVLACMAFPLPFISLSLPPLSLRGRGSTDNTRTTLTSHSTVCQSTLMDARARTRMMPCAHRQMPVSAGQPRDWVHKAEHQGKKPRWQFRGWLPARKETEKVPTSGRATTTTVPAKAYT